MARCRHRRELLRQLRGSLAGVGVPVRYPNFVERLAQLGIRSPVPLDTLGICLAVPRALPRLSAGAGRLAGAASVVSVRCFVVSPYSLAPLSGVRLPPFAFLRRRRLIADEPSAAFTTRRSPAGSPVFVSASIPIPPGRCAVRSKRLSPARLPLRCCRRPRPQPAGKASARRLAVGPARPAGVVVIIVAGPRTLPSRLSGNSQC